jgi:hypothetical protein
MMSGCEAPTAQQLGPLNMEAPEVRAQPANCAYYNAVNAEGEIEPRIPVNLAVTVRMQSPARFAGNAGWFSRVARSRDANTGGVQIGNGDMLPAIEFRPVPVAQLNPEGLSYANDEYAHESGNGSVHFGADSEYVGSPPTFESCPANPAPIPDEECSATNPCQSPVEPRPSPFPGLPTTPRTPGPSPFPLPQQDGEVMPVSTSGVIAARE